MQLNSHPHGVDDYLVKKEGLMNRRSPSQSTGQTPELVTFLLKWFGIGRTIVLSELSDTQKVRGILWVHKVPHSWILSKIISFQARNWDRPWLINLALIAIWALWCGGALFFSFFMNRWLGVVWFIIPAIYAFFVLWDLIKFAKMKAPKTKK